MNDRHETNRACWNRGADWWREQRAADDILPRLREHPELAFDGGAHRFVQQICSRSRLMNACVVGSGDNYAAIALASMGLSVTSVDISEAQLEAAAERAAQVGVSIDFVRADAASMNCTTSEQFDLAVSTNGFFVWIDDLFPVFREIARVLKPTGYYVAYDIHPFQRPWGAENDRMVVAKSYWDTEVPSDGESYERNWTIADILNPLAKSGMFVEEIKESPVSSSRFWEDVTYLPGSNDDLLDWGHNPKAALPVWLALKARKIALRE